MNAYQASTATSAIVHLHKIYKKKNANHPPLVKLTRGRDDRASQVKVANKLAPLLINQGERSFNI